MDMDLDSDEEDNKPAPKKPTKTTTTSSKRKPNSAGTSLKNPYPLEGKYVDEDDRDQYVPLEKHSWCQDLMIVYRHYQRLRGKIS
jgi:hypothetical protein